MRFEAWRAVRFGTGKSLVPLLFMVVFAFPETTAFAGETIELGAGSVNWGFPLDGLGFPLGPSRLRRTVPTPRLLGVPDV
jgi:hypothetical protein